MSTSKPSRSAHRPTTLPRDDLQDNPGVGDDADRTGAATQRERFRTNK